VHWISCQLVYVQREGRVSTQGVVEFQVADMREQEMTRMQMNLAYRTADFETARKLQSRLAPDDPFADPNTVKRLEK